MGFFDTLSGMNSVLAYFIIVGFFIAFGITSKALLKPFVAKWWEGHDNNDQIAFYLSAVGVFYGITLGLFAAGVYQNYSDTEEKAQEEAAAVAALYRDVSSIPNKNSKYIADNLKSYAKFVVDTAWTLHSKGITRSKSYDYIQNIQDSLYGIEPQSRREEILMAEAIKQFNRFIELRRLRLQTVNSGMPMIIWFVIISGGFIVIIMCSLFNIASQRLHNIMNMLMSASIGSLIYLICMMNNPFKGDLAVQPNGLRDVVETIMK